MDKGLFDVFGQPFFCFICGEIYLFFSGIITTS